MIYLIRHGQTALNSAQALQGRGDHPLNETGLQQARRAGEALRRRGIVFQRVFTSPLIRAVQTAEAVAPEVAAETDPRLIEMDYGPYEGTDLRNLPPEILFFFSDFAHNPAPEGMEQLSSVVERVGAFLEELRPLRGNILVSTHAIARKGALEYLT
ncbi:MAG: histidine phosphatase family protein, partial [Oscillospiraceae bacterium]|nr:histidine phosphatase family protein [Oscillospiraceae bacterium]